MENENNNPDVEPNTGNEGTAGTDDKHTEPTTYDQAELDRRVNQALDKAKAQHEKELAKAIEAGKTEGEKLAKMSAAEKAKQAQADLEAKLQAREDELNKRELRATVLDTLSEKQLPSSLADTLVGLGDAEAINKAVEAISTSITEQVAEGIKAGMRQSEPKNGSSSLGSSDDPFAAAEARYKK